MVPSLTTITSPAMATAASCRFFMVTESPIRLGRPIS